MMNITTTEKVKKMKDPSLIARYLDHKRPAVRAGAFVTLFGIENLDDSTLNRMKEMSRDKSPLARTVATLKYAAKGDDSVKYNFIDIIINGSLDEKIELLKIIASRGAVSDEITLQTVMHALLDKKEGVRLQALDAAESIRNRHLVPYIAECLHEKHYKVRLKAARVLFITGGNDVADHLIGLLADRNPEVSSAARIFLTKMDYKLAQKAVNDARFNTLLEGMNGLEPDRKSTVMKIGEEKIREGLSLLHLGCRDKYREVRIESLKSIAVFKSPASVEFVEKLLNDRSYAVRLEAVKTLESIGDQRSLIALEWAAANDGKNLVRSAALMAIIRLKSGK